MVKAGGDHLVRLAGMNMVSTTGALLMVPFTAVPSAKTLGVLLLSTLIHIVYKLGLSRLYAQGDLSEAYPIARGMNTRVRRRARPRAAGRIADVTPGIGHHPSP